MDQFKSEAMYPYLLYRLIDLDLVKVLSKVCSEVLYYTPLTPSSDLNYLGLSQGILNNVRKIGGRGEYSKVSRTCITSPLKKGVTTFEKKNLYECLKAKITFNIEICLFRIVYYSR